MLRGAKQFLDLCTERFPSPRSSQHHSLTVKEGFLILTLMQGETWMSFNLSEVDLELPAETLVDELAALVALEVEERAAQKNGEAKPTPSPNETA